MFLKISSGTAFKAQIEAENSKRYPEVYAHEMAHKTAAGAFAGSIVIDKNADGIITGGHVNIKMPSLNPENPLETKKHAQTVINAAMAPASPSSQDFEVAAQARQALKLAEKAITDQKTGKNLDIAA
ncbi:MAG: hypothetical protein LBK53_02905 [Heliobacteriaceae bacterium]|jgi:hypothetical protein|nr:hypothetical protein [Heliobacteriaceae bacterium]